MLLDLNLLSLHANINKSMFYVQCKSFNCAPRGLFAYMKTCHFTIYKLVSITMVARIVAMRAGRVTMRSSQSHRDFCVSRRSYCYFFAWYCHFMLCLFILCHLCRVNNREAGNLRRHHSHYDVTVIWSQKTICHLSVDAIVIRLISWYMHRRSEWRKVVFSGTSMGSILHLWWGN